MDKPTVRGSGRSTKQIMAAPDKFFFVVGTWNMLNHARTLQRKHAPDKDMDIVTPSQLRVRVKGTTTPVVVDHDAVDRIFHGDLDWLREHMERYNP